MSVERISHYRVVRLLGAGGMGEVYLAEDPLLRRKVALKLLPQRFSDNPQRVKRFQLEARAASQLNHPNIITIYEVGRDRSRHYIATEYIEGQTLRERIRSMQPLSSVEVVDIGIAVATALAAAHGANVLHRDIKPENIMLRPDGYVKVLDFGLAKLLERDGPTMESSSGSVLGTLLYLSPEQAHGFAPDARSDVYSLSAVLYELITRRPPIVTESFVELALAVASRDPAPPSSLVAGVPPELERIVMKGLQKEPSDRYQSARELLDDLRALRRSLDPDASSSAQRKDAVFDMQPTVPLAPVRRTMSLTRMTREFGPRKLAAVLLIVLCAAAIAYAVGRNTGGTDGPISSIAVLPFANVSGDPNSEYLSDGIAESIIDSLATFPRLQVIARSTAFRYRGSAVDPLVVGNELKVRGVVTGQVIARGDTLVVRAALIDVNKGTQIWGEQFNRRISDVLAVQREMSDEITNGLRVKLTGEQKRLIARRTAASPEAYQAYLRGRYHVNRVTDVEVRKALAEFNRAIELQPDYALAYAGLASAYYQLSNVYMAPNEAMPRARAAAERAVQLDGSLAEAHHALGLVRTWYDWDFAAGEREFRRAIELNPNGADGHRYYGDLLMVTGHFGQAIEEKRRAEQLDPLSLAASWDVGRALFYGGRIDEASEQVRKTMDLDPNFPSAYLQRAQISASKGRLDEAIADAKRALDLGGRKPYYLSTWAYLNARAGHRAEALAARSELQASADYTLPLFLARVDAALGDRDEALRLLEKLVAERSESVVWLKVDPSLAVLRDDARFARLVKRVGV